jgi:hypothetical protein
MAATDVRLETFDYAAFTTLFDRRQRVHTRMRLMPPLIIALTV